MRDCFLAGGRIDAYKLVECLVKLIQNLRRHSNSDSPFTGHDVQQSVQTFQVGAVESEGTVIFLLILKTFYLYKTRLKAFSPEIFHTSLLHRHSTSCCLTMPVFAPPQSNSSCHLDPFQFFGIRSQAESIYKFFY